MNPGEPVHGERIVDGNASAGLDLALYISGSETVRELAANEYLVVTDVYIQIEDGGDFTLSSSTAAAGKYIAHGNLAAGGGVVIHFSNPFVCQLEEVPKFIGSATNRSTCIIEGYIVKVGTL